jgi:formate hydrogenlyase subunit 3/multisubunit Na+/H+ antiporter MnhD subunit
MKMKIIVLLLGFVSLFMLVLSHVIQSHPLWGAGVIVFAGFVAMAGIERLLDKEGKS